MKPEAKLNILPRIVLFITQNNLHLCCVKWSCGFTKKTGPRAGMGGAYVFNAIKSGKHEVIVFTSFTKVTKRELLSKTKRVAARVCS
jgi:hypothetical protein